MYTINKKNKRRVSMLLNSQTLYHLNQKAAEEGVDLGEVVDRVVREWRRRERGPDIRIAHGIKIH